MVLGASTKLFLSGPVSIWTGDYVQIVNHFGI